MVCSTKNVILSIILAFFIISPAMAQEEIYVKEESLQGREYVPNEVIVKFKDGVADRIINRINKRFGTKLKFKHPLLNVLRMKIENGLTVKELLEKYRNDPNVEYCEPNFIAQAHFRPNDPYYSKQWNLDNNGTGGINMEAAWDISSSHEDVVVAVIDTGVAYETYSEVVNGVRERYTKASDLNRTRFVPGYDFINNDNHPNDDHGHGTHVTGTIAQSTDNGRSTAGIAYNTSIMPIKVLAADGSGSYFAVADGITWATDQGADVINLSLGGPSASTTLRRACEYAHDRGVLLVCSAGNDGQNRVGYPARYNQCCMAVGATRYDETRAYYSNFGSDLDIVAPGGDNNVDQNKDGFVDGILQQTFNGDRNRLGLWLYQGTSMAAPHVSGVAALLISTGVATTPDDVKNVLQSTAKDLGAPGWDSNFGWGLLDAYAALTVNAPATNLPPTAVPGGPYVGFVNSSVSFNGSDSFDPEDDDITYLWNFGDGRTSTNLNPSHTYTSQGTFVVTLTVNDGIQNSTPSTTTATISIINTQPVANPGGPYQGVEGVSVSFDGSGSFDPEGNTITYFWNFGDGSTVTGAHVKPAHVYSAGGLYTVTLIVSDGFLDSLAVSTTINVQEVNTPPVSKVGGPYSGVQGDLINFDGSDSFDPDGTIRFHDWDFGDGSTERGVNGSNIYAEAGVYTLTLTVIDDKGLTHSSSTTVNVSNQPQEPEPEPEPEPEGEVEVFYDSFEVREWNGLWEEDRQRDWRRSRQRAVEGRYSAEVDGPARDSLLTSIPIDLQGKRNVKITFSWYIEERLDAGEYLAYDVSTDDGLTWAEKGRLRGDEDAEEVWHQVNIDLNNINNLQIRFRGVANSGSEDMDVDEVRVVGW